MENRSAYARLKDIFAEVHLIKSIQNNLAWDMEVMLPSNAIDIRGKQLAFLTSLMATKLRSAEVADLMAKAANEKLQNWDAANLRGMQHIHIHYDAVPVELMAEYVESSNKCNAIWRTAYEQKDWALLEPYLEQLVGLVRQIAQVKAQHLGLSLYDALLDEYDPGRRSQEVDRHFEYLATTLPSLLQEIISNQGSEPHWAISVPIEKQQKLGFECMQDLGFNLANGRLDTSTHPFCNGDYPDIRITTRYNVDDPIMSLYSVLHEAGHAMYQQQLPREWNGQPVGDAHGMSIHESQSLFVEKQMGRHPEFLNSLHHRLNLAFGIKKQKLKPDWLRKYMLYVKPSFIRVDADEVTYPLHVILRYRIERQLIEGKIEVMHIPELWSMYMQELLGITPPDDRLGCLQDIHWPSGAFGYFPTYTLGAMNAAQLAWKLSTEMPEWGDLLRLGQLQPIIQWLGRKVHAYGSLFATADELMQNATGEPLNPEYFIRHLRSRYLDKK